MKMVCSAVLISLTVTVAQAQDPPAVSSGTLIANFTSDPGTMDFEKGTNNLQTWRAANDAAIALQGVGTQTDNIAFDQDELNGLGALIVNDGSGENRHLIGSIGTGLTDATIFWIGHFNPEQNGSIGDGSGQYIYDLGTDGANGTQMDAQIDDDIFEIYGGASTQGGDNIAAWNGIYSSWMTKFHGGTTTIGHEAYCNGENLNVAPTTDGYSTDDSLVLFAYQNSSGTGSSGYNFVGAVHQLLIYQGVLDATDTQAVLDYIDCKLNPCDGDFDGNCVIDGADLSGLLGAWGTDDATADLNGNGLVDGADLAALLGLWGSCSG